MPHEPTRLGRTAPVAPAWVRLVARSIPSAYRRDVVADLLEERDAMIGEGRSKFSAAGWLASHLLFSAVASRRHPSGPGDRSLARRLLPTGPGVGPELRQAARSLRRTPWYAATIVAVVALSMALATTVFAIVDGVLFRPLPYPDADELYAVGGVFDADIDPSPRGIEQLSQPEVLALSDNAPEVALTGLTYTQLNLPDGSPMYAAGIDRQFFDVFGVQLQFGGFTHAQLEPGLLAGGPGPVIPAIIGHQVWQDHFGSDRGIVGRVVRPPTSRPLLWEIVGVLAPDGFIPPLPTLAGEVNFAAHVDALVPSSRPPDDPHRDMVAFARIPEGQLLAAGAALDRAAAAYATTVPLPPADASPAQPRQAAYDRVDLQPIRAYLTRRERPLFAVAFGTVMGLVAVVLLNTAALSGARAAQRRREISLRRALGARGRDLFQHALAEQALLTLPGAAIGLVLCPLLLGTTIELLPPDLSLIRDAQIDWRVAAFTGLLITVTSVLVALLPGLVDRARSRDATMSGLVDQGPAGGHFGRVLVAGQVALAFVLFLGGGFYTASLARVWNEDPGFRTRDAAIVRVVTRQAVARETGLAAAADVRQVPGVASVAIFDAPILRPLFERSSFRLPGADRPPDYRPASFEIGAGFFAATGLRLRDGRLPSDAELDGQVPVLAVSEAVARAYWPDQSAVGQTLLSWRRQPFTVVGVVADARWNAPDREPHGAIYAPWAEGRRAVSQFYLFVTMQADVQQTTASVVDRIPEASSDLRVYSVQRVEDALVDTVRGRRFSALAASVFAAVALLFVTVGLLGLVAMTASRRRREVGIRMALGARPGGVVRQLLSEQLVAVAAGILVGGVVAVWAVGFIESQLYETTTSDPLVWLGAIGTMFTTATLGASIPALRASRIDPVQALRED